MFDLTPDRHTEVLQIEGMSCEHCVKSVRNALQGVSGAAVQSVEIGRAEIDAAPGTTRAQLVEAVEGAGFDVVADES